MLRTVDCSRQRGDTHGFGAAFTPVVMSNRRARLRRCQQSLEAYLSQQSWGLSLLRSVDASNSDDRLASCHTLVNTSRRLPDTKGVSPQSCLSGATLRGSQPGRAMWGVMLRTACPARPSLVANKLASGPHRDQLVEGEQQASPLRAFVCVRRSAHLTKQEGSSLFPHLQLNVWLHVLLLITKHLQGEFDI